MVMVLLDELLPVVEVVELLLHAPRMVDKPIIETKIFQLLTISNPFYFLI